MDAVRAGTRLSPRLVLEHELGHGSTGTVWRGHHDDHGVVAVKVLHGRSPAVVERFQREARLVRRIRSSHVVSVLDHTVDPLPHIIMELISGEDLATRLSREGELPPTEVLRLVTGLCAGLAEAHGLGLIHRDLKPSNVLLTRGGTQPVIVDFGLAKDLAGTISSLTRSGELLGTPHYASPELLGSSRKVDHRADLWAVAVIAYRCLTGALPFSGVSIADLIIASRNGAFLPPTRVLPELTGLVDDWFQRAFAAAPQDRFHDAGEMALALATALRGGRGSRERQPSSAGSHAAEARDAVRRVTGRTRRPTSTVRIRRPAKDEPAADD